jgi:hypothetical protein
MAEREWFERVQSSAVLVRAEGSGYVVDLFAISDDEPHRRALIEQSIALPGGHSRPELERLRGDAVVLIDGPLAAEAVGVDAGLRETERLFAGMTMELSITEDRLLARGRWLPTAIGRERMREVFELDPVDADVPSIAALCEGALICGRSRGLPARVRFAGLATGIYANRDLVANMLDEPEAGLVLALETWPNAVASFTAAQQSTILQNAAEIGARVLGFGFSIRSQTAIDEDWIAYARMSGADLDTIRLLVELAGSELPTLTIAGAEGTFYSALDPGSAWGFAILAEDGAQVAWLTDLEHDDGAVPLIYVEVPDVGRLLQARPEFVRAHESWSAKLTKRGLRVQATLGSDWAPEIGMSLDALD